MNYSPYSDSQALALLTASWLRIVLMFRKVKVTMRKERIRTYALAFIALATVENAPAEASDLVYTPINPSFGGSPFNSAHLLSVANAVNRYKDPNAVEGSDPAQQFLRQIQSRVISAAANQIVDLMFGEDAQDSGTVRFGDQQIDFVRGAETVTLTISNGVDGSVTEIVVPLISTGAPGR